jgi:hypothetical protein
MSRLGEGNQLGSARKDINRRMDVSSSAHLQVSLERAASVLGQKGPQKRGVGHTFSPACHLASRVLFSASEFFEDRRGTLKKCLKVFYFRGLNDALKLSVRKLCFDLIREPATSFKRGGGSSSPNNSQRFLCHSLAVFKLDPTFSIPRRTFFDGHDASLH